MRDPDEWENSAIIPILETLAKAGIAVAAGAIQFELERDMRRGERKNQRNTAQYLLNQRSLDSTLEIATFPSS